MPCSTSDAFERKYGYEAAERAAIYEYEAGMTREEAEEKVKKEIDDNAIPS
jgi:hypothetical protein